jgi:hypothetical protein
MEQLLPRAPRRPPAIGLAEVPHVRMLPDFDRAASQSWSAHDIVRRVRLDPLDPKTSRHMGACEFAAETNAAVLRVILKVKDGMGGDYWWVECHACDCAWQVAYFARETVG